LQCVTHPLDLRDVERIVGLFATNDGRSQRQSERIERRNTDFQLRQIGTMILAVAELQQPVGRDLAVRFGRRHVESNQFVMQIVDAQDMLVERIFKCPPAFVVAQIIERLSQSVIGEIGLAEGHAQPGAQGLQAGRRPGPEMAQAVIALRQNKDQPDGDEVAQTQTHPVAVRRETLINEFRYTHLAQLGEQQRNVVNTFTFDFRGYFLSFGYHPLSLPNLENF